ALLLVVFNALGKPEPVYRGRTVTAWARDLNNPDPLVRSNATEAVRALGPEAAPALARTLGKRDSLFKKPFLAFAPRLPVTWRQKLSRVLKPFNATADRLGAVQALGLLGTNAPVQPFLKALRDPDRQVSALAAAALGGIGAPAVPGLVAALDDPD